jgi:ABC-type transport system involved in multi-copper enzyme maturation permease subunit
MPIFYSLIKVATTFIFKSSAGGITFSLGIMGIPALVKMFSGSIQKILLPIFPQSAIHSLSGAVGKGSTESLGIITSICVLLVWISLTCLVANIKFQRQDI